MRRFWKEVKLEKSTFGHAIRLDGRVVKTPYKNELILPTRLLADAVVQEWDQVGEKIDPAAMPMTGFANAAIDHVAADKAGFAKAIAAYGENELLCYRGEDQDALAERQEQIWGPWLSWATQRYGVAFQLVSGVMHLPQPEPTLIALGKAVALRGTFEMAAMAKAAHLTGSLVLTLALTEQAGDAEQLWDASCLDEIWQAENWGSDYWAEKNRVDRHREFMAAANFLTLAQQI